MSDAVSAPWTDDQVASLNAFQRDHTMHPFTCSNPHTFGESTLRATLYGWECPDRRCGYTQSWAHRFMADWSWRAPLDGATPQPKAGTE